MEIQNQTELRGMVKTITFRNEENNFVIAKIEQENTDEIIAVKGYVHVLFEGDSIILKGRWEDDPKWGRQFRFDTCEPVMPSSQQGIKRFLSSKHIKGIGPVYAERIVDTFGEDTMNILENKPYRLTEVPGIHKKLVDEIVKGWRLHRDVRNIMIFLGEHGISSNYALRIYEKYGSDTINRLRKNPYQLISDIRGIGFKKADAIALKLGLDLKSDERIKAGIIYCIDEIEGKGHVYFPRSELIESAAAILELDVEEVMPRLDELVEAKKIIEDDERIYQTELYRQEEIIAARLKNIHAAKIKSGVFKDEELENIIHRIESDRTVEFADLQKEAIRKSVTSHVMILTGGPGTGKTTTVLGMIDVFSYMRYEVKLCAPTGRAAKRLSETTGMEAQTIHRLLEYDPFRGRFARNDSNKLEGDVFILDEVSMVDTRLMSKFLIAVKKGSTVIFVGDVDQLPSIGPGNVLNDLILSNVFPCIRLTEIFRQAAKSRIVQNAHRINKGILPMTDNDTHGNFFFIKEPNPKKISELIVDLTSRRLPKKYGFDPVNDIQVLSPMHKSETGVSNLNSLLQGRLNPEGERPVVRYAKWEYRTGDKVMQIRNNYDKFIYNGDIGLIVRIDVEEKRVYVQYDTLVEYTFAELDDIIPAYAISVHKSQGSEFPCVIMPVTTQHFIMLKKNLLYTGITRAKKLVVLIGNVKALAIAVKNDQAQERYTSLAERIKNNIT